MSDEPADRLPDDPRDFHEPEQPSIVETPWRVESWRGRFLVVRERPVKGVLERQVDGPNPFSSFATIYEDESAAQARAEKLNEEA